MKNLSKVVFYIVIISSNFLLAQTNTDGRYRTIQLSGHSGAHLYGGETLDDETISSYGALEVKFAWQNSNPEGWASQYGYPSYGFGLYSGELGDPQIFGHPNAFFGFINFPISNPSMRNAFRIEPSLGFTYNLEPYDTEKNPLNDAIGSRVTVYFNVNFGWAYKWTKELDLLYGMDFSHFSNGRSNTPNWGLNMLGLNLGLRYHYNADEFKISKDPYASRSLPARYLRPERKLNTKVEDNQSINLYVAGGTVQTYPEEGESFDNERYNTFSAVVDYQHKFNNMHGVSAGFDFFYDASLETRFPDDSSQYYLAGIHGGYDFMFYKFTIGAHLGTYLTDKRGKEPYFARVSIRYEVFKWAFAQVGLKTDAFAADWIEFGVGFRPFKW